MEVEIDDEQLTRSTTEAVAAEAAAVEAGEETGGGDRCGGGGSGSTMTLTGDPKRHPSSEKDETGTHAKKKRCRRKRKAGEHHRVLHRWKPYDEMTWEERQELDERETLRANRKRDRRFASGQPMAPYNTTQFLMEQHDGDDRTPRSVEAFNEARLELELAGRHRGPDGSCSGDEDSLSDSPYSGFEESYLQRDFIKAYETYRAERLQGLTKDELVKECLVMEARLDCLQGTIERLKESTEFVTKLREENERLSKENELLKTDSDTRTEARDILTPNSV